MRFFMTLTVCWCLAIVGCQSNSSSGTNGKVKQSIASTAEKLDTAREAYVAHLLKDLEQADKDIDDLKARGAKAANEIKDKFEKRIKELEASRDATRKNYDELKSDKKNAWDDLKQAMDKAWHSLKESIQKAKDEFK